MRLGDCWSAIRAVLAEFSTARIRNILGAAGVPLHQVYSYMDDPRSTYKEHLLTALDCYIQSIPSECRERIIINTIEEMLIRDPSIEEYLNRVLNRVGWGITGGRLYPIKVQVTIEAAELSEGVRDNLQKALTRYRDGDWAGAITAICGAIDSLTAEVYAANPSLGDHRNASYQERVARSFSLYGAKFVSSMVEHGMSKEEADRLWRNLRGAINHAAYVLQVYRREYGDTHGNVHAPSTLVQHVLDCATFILRSFEWLGGSREQATQGRGVDN